MKIASKNMSRFSFQPFSRRHFRVCLFFVFFGLVATGFSQAHATTFTVTNTNDSGSGSLRNAITLANNDYGNPSTVVFDSSFNSAKTINVGFAMEVVNDITIDGPGSNLLTLNGGSDRRIFYCDNNGTNFSIEGMKLTNGVQSSGEFNNGGGAIYFGGDSLSISNCIFTSNKSNGGGAVRYSGDGTASISNCTFQSNRAEFDSNPNDSNFGGSGGALEASGTTTVTDCTFDSNSTDGGQGGSVYVDGTVSMVRCTLKSSTQNNNGGGVYVPGNTTLNMTNCTVVSNTASSFGGGVYGSSSSHLNLVNCTITGNTASIGRAGGLRASSDTKLLNTIVAENTAPSQSGGTGKDVDGTVNSQGNNFIGFKGGSSGWNGTDLGGSGSTVSPGLQALATNAGPANNNNPTQTRALDSNSPCRDAGNNTGAPATDQRGLARPQNLTVDIGAFEYDATGQAPVVSNTFPNVIAVEDDAPLAFDLHFYFSDPQDTDTALTYSVTSNSNTGLVTTNISSTATDDTLSLTFVANASGTATIVVRATDTSGLSIEDSFDVNVSAVNDAPVLDNTKSPALADEVDAPPSGAVGTLVSSLVDYASPSGQVDNVVDVDSGALLGIAITAVDETQGQWYYSINNGSSWSLVGSVSNTNARLLKADSNSRVFFKPATSQGVIAGGSFTFRAWDTTSGTNGSTANTSTNGGSSAFSSATDTVSILMLAANDTPVVTNINAAEQYREDTPLNLIDMVVSDVDSTNANVIITFDGTAGSLNNDTDGTATASYSSGFYFASGPIANINNILSRLTFTPASNYRGSFNMAVSIADGDTAATGSKPFSVANSAPVLDISKTPTLSNSTDVPVSGPIGTPVSSLADLTPPSGGLDNISDVDNNAVAGIAITATYSAGGSWYYTTDNGTNWSLIGSVSNTSALLLKADSNSRVYLKMDAATTLGEGDLTFRAWDTTSGTNGTKADTSTNGGTTAFSTATDTTNRPLIPGANDAPTATNVNKAVSYTEDTPVNVNDMVVTDPDGPAYNTWLQWPNNVGTFSSTYNSGATTVSKSNGDMLISHGSLAEANDYLAHLVFTPNANYNGTFTVTVSIADSQTGVTGHRTFTGTAVQDAPVLDNTKSPVLSNQSQNAGVPTGAAGTLVSSLVDFASPAGQVDNVTDPDSGAQLGIAVTATDDANGVWYYTIDGGTTWGLVGDVSNDTALLLPADANTRLYFKPNTSFTGAVTNGITFRAWDRTIGTPGNVGDTTFNGGTYAFSTATDTAAITVIANLAPTSVAPASATTPQNTALAFTGVNALSVADGDTANLTVSLSVGQGTLSMTTLTGLNFTVNDGTDEASMTFDGSVTNLNAALATLVYKPAAPYTGNDSLTFSVSDGIADPVIKSVFLTVTVPDNAAPVLDASKSPSLNALDEDSGDPSGAVGTLVSSLVDLDPPSGGLDNVTDSDADPETGLAITAADTTSGAWYYTTDGGTNWNSLGSVSATSALLLFANSDTRLYFKPAANFSGTVASGITFRAWDRTGESGNGDTADVSTNGDATPFSTATDTASITVTNVNDAPVLDAAKSPALSAVAEDAGVPSGTVGTPVSNLVDFALPTGQVDNVTDVDSGAQLGVAVTAADTTNGTWYYSTDGGTNWNALGSVSDSNARLLAADANTRLYFQPNSNFNGTVSSAITFRAWDQTSGTNGSTTTSSPGGGTSAFSTATDTAGISVTAVNDAPSLDASKSPALSAVTEDAGSPVGLVGTQVSSLVDFATPSGGLDNVTDIDSSPQLGIAITAADTTNGTWFYSTNNGSTWSPLGSVSDSNARLLAADSNSRLYFQPNTNVSGTLNNVITFRAWDQTSGTNGGTASTTPGGGTSAFSSTTDTASILVNAVNDAPVLDASKSPVLSAVNEDAADPVGSVGTLVSSLVDFATPSGGLDNVTDVDSGALRGIAVTAADTTNGSWFYSTDDGANWSALGSVSDSSARLLPADSDTRLYFKPAANFNGTVNSALTFRAWDQTNGTSGGTASTTPNGGTTAFSSASDTASIAVTSVNDAPTSSAPSSITKNEDTEITFTGGDLLTVADNDGDLLSVSLTCSQGSLSVTTTTGLDTATGSGTSSMTLVGSVTNLNNSLATLKFTPTPDYNSTAAVSFSVSDGDADPVTKDINLTINAVADVVDDSLTTAEDTAITCNPITGTNGASADNFENPTHPITAVTQGTNGGVTFTSNSVTYTPDADYYGPDSFTYTVTSGGVTETGTISVTVTAVNDAPTATNLNAAETYTEDTTLNLTDIVVSDIDSSVVTVTLALSDAAAGTLGTDTSGSVTSTYAEITGTWTASGPKTDVNTLLSGLTFTPASNYNSNFSISTKVSDGDKEVTGSKAFTGTAVNDKPTVVDDIDDVTVDEDAADSVGDVAPNFYDVEDDANLTYSLEGNDNTTLVTVTHIGSSFTLHFNANQYGTANITIRATDPDEEYVEDTFKVTVNSVNDVPVLGTIANTSGNEGTAITFTATASDDDSGDSLTFSLKNAPTGATINPETGVFSWTPTDAQGPGEYTFTIKVKDGHGGCDEQSVTITVYEVNQAPTITPIPEKTAPESTLLTFAVAAVDGDIPTQTLSYWLEGAPVGADIGGSTGVFTWTPTEAQGPGTYNFKVKVSDGTATSEKPIKINVTEANQPPVLAVIGNKTVTEEGTLTFTVSGSDPDVPVNALTFSASGLPAGATFTPATRTFTWTPTEAQGPATYNLIFRVSDGSLTDSKAVSITVNETNKAPVLNVGSARTIVGDKWTTFSVSATDSDLPANALQYSVTPPAAITGVGTPQVFVDSTSGAISVYAPPSTVSYTFPLMIKVTDSGAPSQSDTKTLNITVTPPLVVWMVTPTFTSTDLTAVYKLKNNSTQPLTGVWIQGTAYAQVLSVTKSVGTVTQQAQSGGLTGLVWNGFSLGVGQEATLTVKLKRLTGSGKLMMGVLYPSFSTTGNGTVPNATPVVNTP